MIRETIFSLLQQLALDHPKCGNQKIVSCLMYRQVRVFGFNQYKTHPLQDKYKRSEGAIYLHSELDAIRKFVRLSTKISQATLFVCRVRSNGELLPGFPCSGCQKAIVAFDIPKVWYSSPSSFSLWGRKGDEQ